VPLGRIERAAGPAEHLVVLVMVRIADDLEDLRIAMSSARQLGVLLPRESDPSNPYSGVLVAKCSP
jgi:hypothetical protein